MTLEINTDDFWKELDQRVIDARTERKLFIEEITTLRAKVAELEAKLEKYQNLDPFGFWHQGNDIDESDFFLYSESGDVSCSKCIKLYALEK